MDLNALYALLERTTAQFRKGPEVEHRESGGLAVTEIYAMPAAADAPPEFVQVDMTLIVVGVDKAKAEAERAALLALLAAYPEPERLAGGPSYIEVGAVIGDQGAAFQLFALGKVLELWDVITPATLGLTGEDARAMAGAGLVMMSGYPRPAAADLGV